MCTLDIPQTPVGDDSMEVPESEEGTPAPSEGSRSGKKARGGKKSVAPLKIKLNKRKKKKTSSVSSCLFVAACLLMCSLLLTMWSFFTNVDTEKMYNPTLICNDIRGLVHYDCCVFWPKWSTDVHSLIIINLTCIVAKSPLM